jgi:alpha-D-ribose 1-methylphosphonate 5-triphosphate synthase subunit PhnL
VLKRGYHHGNLRQALVDATLDLIAEKKKAGVALLGIFHDQDVREAVATRLFPMTAPAKATA